MEHRTAQEAPRPVEGTALPDFWAESWGSPADHLSDQLAELRQSMETLATDLTFIDRTSQLSDLVGSADLREQPVHRWFYYKEGFSPHLPSLIVDLLGTGNSRTVVDCFAGVGTTALTLREHKLVNKVIGIEYSPLACFVGQTKLDAVNLQSSVLRDHISRWQPFPDWSTDSKIPSLAAFHNKEVFDPETLRQLIAMRDLIKNDEFLSTYEKNFFLLGIVAVVEDLSKVMKDGRALRILRGRQRRKQGLRPLSNAVHGDSVTAVVLNQWLAMVEDVEQVSGRRDTCNAKQVRGDARALLEVRDANGSPTIPCSSVGLYLYSPPYLNYIDYTEVYKMELWFLELIKDQVSFRSLREGTLRSHPSIKFPHREKPVDGAKVFQIIEKMSDFLTQNLARPSIGVIPEYYFNDMYEVLLSQYETLEPNGAIACIVANSTLSRRTKSDSSKEEIWRMPILTDVILARLAEAAGFVDIEIWKARALQAKNVNGGFARESVIVARKPVA